MLDAGERSICQEGSIVRRSGFGSIGICATNSKNESAMGFGLRELAKAFSVDLLAKADSSEFNSLNNRSFLVSFSSTGIVPPLSISDPLEYSRFRQIVEHLDQESKAGPNDAAATNTHFTTIDLIHYTDDLWPSRLRSASFLFYAEDTGT